MKKKGKSELAFVDTKILILFCILVLFIVGGWVLAKVVYSWSAKVVASHYFHDVIQNDYHLTYQYLKEEEGPFVSEKQLEEKMSPLGTIRNISIIETKKNGDLTDVVFAFDLEGNRNTATVTLTCEKIGPFQKYKVKSSALAYDVKIRVLKDSHVTIDGKEITSFFTKDDRELYYDVYVIPAMIKGNYQVVVEMPNGFHKEVAVNIDSSNPYTFNKVSISEEEAQNYGYLVLNALDKLYQSAALGKSYQEIAHLFSYPLESVYASVQKSMQSTEKNISHIHFTGLQITSSQFNEKGNLELEVFADYLLRYSYVENGVKKEKSENKYMSLTIELLYQKGHFVLSDISTSYNVK